MQADSLFFRSILSAILDVFHGVPDFRMRHHVGGATKGLGEFVQLLCDIARFRLDSKLDSSFLFLVMTLPHSDTQWRPLSQFHTALQRAPTRQHN